VSRIGVGSASDRRSHSEECNRRALVDPRLDADDRCAGPRRPPQDLGACWVAPPPHLRSRKPGARGLQSCCVRARLLCRVRLPSCLTLDLAALRSRLPCGRPVSRPIALRLPFLRFCSPPMLARGRLPLRFPIRIGRHRCSQALSGLALGDSCRDLACQAYSIPTASLGSSPSESVHILSRTPLGWPCPSFPLAVQMLPHSPLTRV
jgi:hypothetical protein